MKINVRSEYERLEELVSIVYLAQINTGLINRDGIMKVIVSRDYPNPETKCDEIMEMLKRKKYTLPF